MPTVLRLGRLRVVIYPNDHRPPHVHILGDGHEAVFEIFEGELRLRQNFGFSRSQIASIRDALKHRTEELCVVWEKLHG